MQEELNKNLFDSLIKFLQKSHSGFQKNSRDWGCQIKLREIPTAALILGMYRFVCLLKLVALFLRIICSGKPVCRSHLQN